MNHYCFFISPIGNKKSSIRERADKVFKELIKPATQKCGYEAIRADQIAQPGIITPLIIDHILNDPFAIADLSGKNANVFYELAIRHLSRKPFVMIIDEGEEIPFNIKDMRIIYINTDKLIDSENLLIDYIKNAEQLGRNISSPITQYNDLDVLNHYQGAAYLLPALIFPTIVIRYSLARFIYELKHHFHLRNYLWDICFFLAYRCNAQITILDNKGIILSHTNPSSRKRDARPHIGNFLWNNVGFSLEERPFTCIVQSKEKQGWLLWTDNTYSLLHSNKYLSIMGRESHRINLAYFIKIKKRIYVLEIHQEIDYELHSSLNEIIVNIVIERVKHAEKEFKEDIQSILSIR